MMRIFEETKRNFSESYDVDYLNPQLQEANVTCSSSKTLEIGIEIPRDYSTLLNKKDLFAISDGCGSYANITDDCFCIDQEAKRILTAIKESEEEEEEIKKVEMSEHCMTIVLTLLHTVISLLMAFGCAFSVISWTSDEQCLPRLVDHFGDPIEFVNGLSEACRTVTYGLGFFCLFNVLMIVGLQCWRRSTGLMIFHLMIVTIFGAFVVFSGSLFTVHYLLWCDSLAEKMPIKNVRCDLAAQSFDFEHDSSNMTASKTRMEIQQASVWALFPFTFIAVIAYAFLIKMMSSDNSGDYENLSARSADLDRQRNSYYNRNQIPVYRNYEREPLVGRTNHGSDVDGGLRERTMPSVPSETVGNSQLIQTERNRTPPPAYQ